MMAPMTKSDTSANCDPASGEPAASKPRLAVRDAALRTLADLRTGRRTAKASIEELTTRSSLSDQDLGLLQELVMGVQRHRMTLARVLGLFTARGWQQVGQGIRDILMLAGYQLIWLDRIPAFAAVNEAVRQAKSEGGGAGRFVNAVLRELLRTIEHHRLSESDADPIRAVMLGDGRACQFRREVFPDPAVDAVAYLAESTSHPTWLVARWLRAFGRERTLQICRAGMTRPPVFLRANPLKTDLPRLIEALGKDGITAEPTEEPGTAVVLHAAGLARSGALRDAWCQPQDRTAMEVVRRMAPRPGEIVVDLCAAPGTKTTQIAEYLAGDGQILATDRDERKAKALAEHCAKLGYTNVRVLSLPEIENAVSGLPRPPDWILIDAPCGNTGVLARRPEARYRASARALEALVAVQRQLLGFAAGLAGGTTRIAYSTCSIEHEENAGQAAWFAHEHPGWRLLDSALTLPSAGDRPQNWRDGGYWSLWGR